jgi:hypothetical protein
MEGSQMRPVAEMEKVGFWLTGRRRAWIAIPNVILRPIHGQTNK